MGDSAVRKSKTVAWQCKRVLAVLGLCLSALLIGGGTAWADPELLRVGHFPNVTHVQALVAQGLSRAGKGWFEERLGPDVKIEWYIYNAGPSAMEAVFARSIDLTYVGPSPAINAYAKAGGDEIRIVAGAANGGSALVVQPDSGIKTAADLRGKRLATPQFGNTQDVAARAWLMAGGLKITQTGGDAHVIPTENPDQLSLFKQKQLDAVWTVEPWVSRLELEAGGIVVVDEADAVTTVLVSSVAALDQRRDLVRRFVAAHRALTDWIEAHPDEAQKLVLDELAVETHGAIKPELVAHAWTRIRLTAEVSRDTLERFVSQAKAAGLLKTTPDLSRLIEQP
jgi:NitT/TauT family transport system substrate-binding protein